MTPITDPTHLMQLAANIQAAHVALYTATAAKVSTATALNAANKGMAPALEAARRAYEATARPLHDADTAAAADLLTAQKAVATAESAALAYIANPTPPAPLPAA